MFKKEVFMTEFPFLKTLEEKYCVLGNPEVQRLSEWVLRTSYGHSRELTISSTYENNEKIYGILENEIDDSYEGYDYSYTYGQEYESPGETVLDWILRKNLTNKLKYLVLANTGYFDDDYSNKHRGWHRIIIFKMPKKGLPELIEKVRKMIKEEVKKEIEAE